MNRQSFIALSSFTNHLGIIADTYTKKKFIVVPSTSPVDLSLNNSTTSSKITSSSKNGTGKIKLMYYGDEINFCYKIYK